MEERLIAPCGMNCAVCSGYLAMQNDLKKGFLEISGIARFLLVFIVAWIKRVIQA